MGGGDNAHRRRPGQVHIHGGLCMRPREHKEGDAPVEAGEQAPGRRARGPWDSRRAVGAEDALWSGRRSSGTCGVPADCLPTHADS